MSDPRTGGTIPRKPLRLWPGVVLLGLVLSTFLGCSGSTPVRVELIEEPVTLSPAPLLLSGEDPLRADHVSVGVCIFPDLGYHVSGRWTVLTPEGRDAQVIAAAELVNGEVVRFAAPSSTPTSLCVHPRRGGPLEAPVQRVRIAASTLIIAQRIVWQ